MFIFSFLLLFFLLSLILIIFCFCFISFHWVHSILIFLFGGLFFVQICSICVPFSFVLSSFFLFNFKFHILFIYSFFFIFFRLLQKKQMWHFQWSDALRKIQGSQNIDPKMRKSGFPEHCKIKIFALAIFFFKDAEALALDSKRFCRMCYIYKIDYSRSVFVPESRHADLFCCINRA